MVEFAFGSYVLDWNEDFNWSFIPWPFVMWSPFRSRVCSFSIVVKDWQFLLEFHLQLVAVFSFFSRVGTGHVLLCSMFRHPSVGCITCRMFFPSSFAPFAFSLRVQFPEWSVQPFVAVPWGEPISVYSYIDVQFPADSDGCFYECVDMCGLLEVLFDTLLYPLND